VRGSRALRAVAVGVVNRAWEINRPALRLGLVSFEADPSGLTTARRLCDHVFSIKSAGVRPAPNLSRTKVGTGVPKRITGDAVPRRDKDGGMTRPERVVVF
jgi:hypothetical protein